MTHIRRLTSPRPLVLAIAIAGVAGCSDDDSPVAPPRPVLTAISVSLPKPSIELGEMVTAIAVGLDQTGTPLTISPVEWMSEKPEVAAVQPSTGLIFALGEGTTKLTATFEGKIGERTITVTKSPGIRINEVQPRADTPNGWIEFFNPTSAPVDLAGWTLIDNNFFGPIFTFPPNSVIQAGGYLVIEETALPFGIDATDNARLFSRFGVLVDVVFWPTQPQTTFGRCPDGGTQFIPTGAASKGTTNICT